MIISVLFNNPVKMKSPGFLEEESGKSPSMDRSRIRIRFINFKTDGDLSKKIPDI